MTPILFSLIALTVTFAALVAWAYSSKTQQRWDQASQLPFDDDTDPNNNHASTGASQDD